MSKFYLTLWVRWATAFILIATVSAVGAATLVTFVVYALKGFAELNHERMQALQTIWLFWLSVGYGLGLIIALVGALKSILYRCVEQRKLVLVNCKEETIFSFEVKPYLKLWRKWFFAIIWINAAQAIIFIVAHKVIWGGSVWLGWFNPWSVTLMILFSGIIALVMMIRRSSRLRIEACN
ncbi:hypothetical protein [Sulfuricurvum sp.]|uniref:hypothetical protein n=1 Tax=Sulfuricurvum sp. TaxID=2025608 RepID=UPI00261C7674|nr:hypothetical protein [Sulfuricurvum sp.]MDD2782163.1 hypothetical protein [Sulfuricurvum sp.]